MLFCFFARHWRGRRKKTKRQKGPTNVLGSLVGFGISGLELSRQIALKINHYAGLGGGWFWFAGDGRGQGEIVDEGITRFPWLTALAF